MLLLAVVAGVAATLLAFPRGPSAYLVSPDKCLLTGSFSRDGAYTTTVFPSPSDSGEMAFGSWSGNDSYTGKFSTALFRAPRLINFFVSGYPRKEGISLYLEDAVRNGRRLALEARADPRESWRRFEWTLPDGWRGQMVRLVAEDRSQALGGWIGVTLPRAGGAQSALPRLGNAAAYAAAMGAEGMLFLLPGFVLAMLLERRFALDGFRFTAAAITGAATVGYLAFWIYFADVDAGKVASWLVVGTSLVAAPVLLRRGWKRSAAVWREFAVAAALVFAVAWFYLGVGYLYKAGDPADLQAAERVTLWQLPPDHLLPWELADHVYNEAPLRPHLMGYWKSSDRPPLQAGIVLAQLPFWHVFRGQIHYHLLAIFLQSLWAGGLWIFLCSAGVARRTVLIVLGLSVFSGFFFLYSFYVWPKLLAAALFLIGLTFSTFNRPDYRWTAFDAALSAAAIALGMLSHTGVLLAAPGILWVLYRNRALPGPRIAVRAAATVVLFCLPWVAYQKWYDPPGDLLLKLHLAASLDEERPFGQLLGEAYGKLSAAGWARNKLDNVGALFVPVKVEEFFEPNALARYDTFSRANFFTMVPALGLLNLGLLFRLGMRWMGRRPPPSPEIRLADRCAVAALVSIVIWCLVMFGPGSTVIHQGSLAVMMLLFLGFGVYLAALTPLLGRVAFAVQALAVFPLFVFGKPAFGNPPGTLLEGAYDPSFGLVAILAVAGLLVWAEFAAREPAAPHR